MSTACPNEKELTGFVQGELSDQEISLVQQHLEGCSACGDTVRSLHANDTVASFVRNLDSAEHTSVDTDEPCIKELINELKQLPTRADRVFRADSVCSAPDPEFGSREGSADEQLRIDEVAALLEPAESTGEIGRLAHYRVLQSLGVGGMGVVFHAEDTKLKRFVALKILRPSLGESARERFMQEARAAAAINHDNVITIYDVGHEGPLAFLAMQWLEGETLEQRLQRKKSLPAEEVRRIAAEVADGLSAAHSKKLVHRDIKPANVWIEADRDRARILDFGLARVADADSQLTETGIIAGTPAYMSPEQAMGKSVDTRTDLFSLGSMMYRMLTGRLPFESANALATIRAIQNDQPTDVSTLNPQVPNDLSESVDRLMEKDPELRDGLGIGSGKSLAETRRDHNANQINHETDASIDF